MKEEKKKEEIEKFRQRLIATRVRDLAMKLLTDPVAFAIYHQPFQLQGKSMWHTVQSLVDIWMYANKRLDEIGGSKNGRGAEGLQKE